MRRNRFFLVSSTLFLLVVLVGFTRSFYLKSHFDFPELPSHLYLHGIALTAWFALACMQPWLIRSNKIELHRKFGLIGAAIATCVFVTSLWTVVLRDAPEIDESPARAAGNLASILMFLSCVVLGFVFRRNSGVHKRLMLLASIPILAPALDRFARIPGINEFWGRLLFWLPAPPEVAFAFVAFLLLLMAVVVNDMISERKLHKGTVIGLFSIIVLAPATTFLIIASGAWSKFVHWVT